MGEEENSVLGNNSETISGDINQTDSSVQDIQDYCTNTENLILAHGTTSDMVDSIKEHGLIVRALNHPTVLFVNNGITNRVPVTEYTWQEPHSFDGEGCCLIIEIPKEIKKMLEENDLDVVQSKIFSLIYKKEKFIVKEDSYDSTTPMILRPPGNAFRIFPTMGRTDKLPVGAEYFKDVIPLEFILAVTTRDKVFFDNKERFELLSDEKKQEIINLARERVKTLKKS